MPPDDKKKKKKKAPPAPPPPAKKPAANAPAAVGRDQAPNILQDGEVFVLLTEPAIADDEYLLVPLKKDSKKKPPTTSKSKVTDAHTAVEFSNVVLTKDFFYELIHVRAGKSKNRIRAKIAGSMLPKFAKDAALPRTEFPSAKKKKIPDESPKDPDLQDERVMDYGTLEAEDPEE
jgi:hypothetical protein